MGPETLRSIQGDRALLVTVAAALLLAVAACIQTSPTPTATPTSRPLHEVPLVTGPVSPTGIKAILGTSDLAVGPNRVGFVLQTAQALVTIPEATVSSQYYPTKDSQGETRETVTATFRLWPYGTRGMYTTQMSFDQPGWWGLDIRFKDADGAQRGAQLLFEVKRVPATPPVGAKAPPSKSKTVQDVASPKDLTTGSLIDLDLYQMTVAEAVGSGKPTVVVMTSPAYCTNAVCGPEDEVLRDLKNAYKGRANFIHVDVYDNPTEIKGDLSKVRLSPTAVEWNLPSIEWTFVIDRDGVIAARFEAFATYQELEEALLKVLR
ncbi:MAG: thioredoxin family protein [Chloroflexi bacterium]|nr:thioredoxin family protein [Chloroflexota bacterium]